MYGTVLFEILSDFSMILIFTKIIFCKHYKAEIRTNQSTEIHLMNWSVSDIEIWSSAFLIWHDLQDKIDNFDFNKI